MKRTILLLITAAAAMQSATAQGYRQGTEHRKRFWVDLQVAQHAGLNKWSDAGYANDGFPRASLTEIRAAGNLYIVKPVFGVFLDMGIGIMPAPRMGSLDLGRMPMPNSGTQYYLREMLSESGANGATAHFRIAAGVFGDFRAAGKLNVMPYLGIGGLTMSPRSYEMVLKEQGSNNQYYTKYTWGLDGDDEYDSGSRMFGHLTARLMFKYKFSLKTSLLFGLEYTGFFDTPGFYGRHTNTFNGNVRKSFAADSNNMNMLGLSVGISFM